MKRLLPLFFIFSALVAQSQYVTPGTGVKWDLETLAANSEGIISLIGANYVMGGSVVISANDTLEILSDGVLLFMGLSYIESYGTLIVDAPDQMVFSAFDHQATDKWRGIRFYEGHYTYLRNAIFEYGGGLKVGNGGNFYMDACTLRYNYYQSGASFTSSGALDITGPATIINSEIYENQRAAIGTASNTSSPIIFRNNYLFGNTAENSNRPQINLGPSGPGNTSYIVGNTVIGNGNTSSGGIAYSSLLGVEGDVVIDSNYVEANRYGIALTGSGMNAWIRYNTVIDNNIQNEPNLGGSGLNFTGSSASTYQHAMVTGNIITGNLWGITIIGYPVVNMGNNDPEDYNPGLNVFSGNGNGGVTYDLYNNGPVTQYAMGNLWDVAVQDEASIETVITHQPDISTLGLVYYWPAAQKATFEATDSETTPLEGVSIAVDGLETLLSTDVEGLADLITMQGEYTFTASLEGYEDFSGSFTLGTEAIQIPIQMSEITYTVTFEVTDGTDPVEGASIDISGQTLTTDANGEAFIALTNGTYPFEVTATDFTTATGDVVVDGQDLTIPVTITSTVGITELQGFRIYPNPASSYVRIEGQTIQKAELRQLQGVLVRSWDSPASTLSVEGLPSGYYFLHLYTYGQVIVHRLIIQ
ncbi:MAG: T9SS type A sorting domain-containing protein [Bacteroides sp.]|jgi:hypothetical protein|nr:T9SS type A sorting domain-containing protein [Bacteroides sp.]